MGIKNIMEELKNDLTGNNNPQEGVAAAAPQEEVSLDLDKPEEPTAVEAPAPVQAGKLHGEVDPSFNCVPCVGEGLLANGSICTECKGTGKSQGNAAGGYPEGTFVLKPEGAFVVNNGELVAQGGNE